jgi:hypothetical protein
VSGSALCRDHCTTAFHRRSQTQKKVKVGQAKIMDPSHVSFLPTRLSSVLTILPAACVVRDRDLEYSLQTSDTAGAMLRGSLPGPGPRPLANWLTLLKAVQNMDPVSGAVHSQYLSSDDPRSGAAGEFLVVSLCFVWR